MTKAVFGLISNEEQAKRVVDRLIFSGFSNTDISILSPDKKNMTTTNERGEVVLSSSKRGSLSTERSPKAPEGGALGAATGGVLGGTLGLLAGVGALAIPGLGPFVAAGPILAALSGSAVGGSLGLVIGALVGCGIPEYEAKKYESGLQAGNILISVHTENEDEINRATDILKKEGAKEISSSREKARSMF